MEYLCLRNKISRFFLARKHLETADQVFMSIGGINLVYGTHKSSRFMVQRYFAAYCNNPRDVFRKPIGCVSGYEALTYIRKMW